MEDSTKKPVRLILIGAGNRGSTYTNLAIEQPELCQVVAVAEPRDFTRKKFAEKHKIAPENVFKCWKDIVNLPNKIEADAVLICTLDQYHEEPTIAFANLKYNILLEKPMALTEEQCERIHNAIKSNEVKYFIVCHVLRYTRLMRMVKSYIHDLNKIGKIVNIQHLEPVGAHHFTHSYVRGNWKNSKWSSPILMAKSCHDIDLIYHMVQPRDWKTKPVKCTSINSFGSLNHFKPENKPEGATDRCMTCPLEKKCAWSAKEYYYERNFKKGNLGWPVAVIVEDVTEENVLKALEEGPYGECVYNGQNDQLDNQVVTMTFDNGAIATFSMVAFTEAQCVRKTKIMGTEGEIQIDGEHGFHYFNFLTRESVDVDLSSEIPDTKIKGHGYADYFMFKSFIDAIKNNDESLLLSNGEETLHTHKLVFRAEEARAKGQTIYL